MPPNSSVDGYFPIIYSITQKYDDPISKGFIKIDASSTIEDRGKPENLLNWDSSSYWVSNKSQNQYFTIEFNSFYFIDGYAFRTIGNEHTLQHWEIQGSVNGFQWLKIDKRDENICEGNFGKRTSNATVCMVSLTKYFKVSDQGIFRFIRMMQIGRNTETDEDHKADNFGYTFYLRSFELYGKFFRSNFRITCKNFFPRICFSLLWIELYLT